MSWKEPAERHSDAMVEAIHAASRHIVTALKEGFELMASVEDKALADLTAAISSIGDAITAEIAALTAALANQGVDNSPAIEASVTKLTDLTAGLKASLPTPPAI